MPQRKGETRSEGTASAEGHGHLERILRPAKDAGGGGSGNGAQLAHPLRAGSGRQKSPLPARRLEESRIERAPKVSDQQQNKSRAGGRA